MSTITVTVLARFITAFAALYVFMQVKLVVVVFVVVVVVLEVWTLR